MKNTVILSILCTALAWGAGCSLLSTPEYKEVAFYDLAAEKGVERITSVPAEFRSFSESGGNGVRFPVRESGGRVRFDSCNCFAAPPAQLIRSRLIGLFPAAYSDDAVKVNALLNRFECDRQSGKTFMSIDYQLLYNKQKKAVRHELETKVSKFDGPGIAAAFEKTVIRSAQRLAGEIMVFKKQCAGKKEKRK